MRCEEIRVDRERVTGRHLVLMGLIRLVMEGLVWLASVAGRWP